MTKVLPVFLVLAVLGLMSCSDGNNEEAKSGALNEPAKAHYQTASIQITFLKQGWTSTGLIIGSGGEATIAAEGKIDMGLPNPFEPRHTLWARVGESGTIFQLASNHHSFVSEESGELFVAMSPSGLLWANRQGDLLDVVSQMPDAPLDIAVDVFVWADTAERGLSLMLNDSARVALAENSLQSIKATKELPHGYEYLWYLAQSNVFSGFSEGERQGIHAKTNDDFGIIKKPLDIPLTADTKISFDWLYSHLPALVSETDPANHDYLSIALEFENGQDITWMWSKDLQPETSFECPLPEWQHRETHIVLQSGVEGLGEWYSHTRSVQKDYAAAVGGEIPSRIVGVWIIGNAVFGRQPAEAYFANAVVSDGESLHKLM